MFKSISLVLPLIWWGLCGIDKSEGLDCRGTYFRPVCGTNGYRYKNLCWMKFYGYYSYEDVERLPLHNCTTPAEYCPCKRRYRCNPDDNPICGYTVASKTHQNYNNLCDFQCASFCDPHLYFVKCGHCDVKDSYEMYDYDQCLSYIHTDHYGTGHVQPTYTVNRKKALLLRKRTRKIITEEKEGSEELYSREGVHGTHGNHGKIVTEITEEEIVDDGSEGANEMMDEGNYEQQQDSESEYEAPSPPPSAGYPSPPHPHPPQAEPHPPPNHG